MLTGRRAAAALGAAAACAVAWHAVSDGDAQRHTVVSAPAPTVPVASTPRTPPPEQEVAARSPRRAVSRRPQRRRDDASVPSRRAGAGDLVISGIAGHVASASLLRRVRQGRVAGVIVMGDNVVSVEQVRALTDAIRRAARAGRQLPPLIMTDQEGGTVKRFQSGAPSRSAHAMAALPTHDITQSGRRTAADLLARGVNVNLAPVVDVGGTPSNFLGSRTFASSPAGVARAACSFARGLVAGGVAATLKHFPGLGDAGAVSTDTGPVVIDRSLTHLQREWAPYASCPTGDHALVMISSAVYPQLTGSEPAVLSPATYDALRTVAPRAPTITDALEGDAVRHEPQVAERAVRAGADLLLYTGEEDAVAGRSALETAIASGRISRATLRERAQRVRALRRSLAPG